MDTGPMVIIGKVMFAVAGILGLAAVELHLRLASKDKLSDTHAHTHHKINSLFLFLIALALLMSSYHLMMSAEIREIKEQLKTEASQRLSP